MNYTTHTHTAQSFYDTDWTVSVFEEGVQVHVKFYPIVRLNWEQASDPEHLTEVFGFMHVTGFVILAQRLGELFQDHSEKQK